VYVTPVNKQEDKSKMQPLIKNNKKEKLTWIDIEPMIAIIIIGLMVAMIGPNNLRKIMLILPFALSIIGLVFLIISKVSLFRQGIWFSFGSKFMTRGYSRIYKLSYILIAIGVLCLLFLANRIT